MSPNRVKNIKFLVPSLPEQQKVGNFFYKIDKKLELQQERIEILKEYKKGMMQKIFSQEIRFKDENGKDYPDWKEKKLGEISDIRSSKRIYADDYRKEGIPFYRSTEIISEDFNNEIIYISKEKYIEIEKNHNVPKSGEILVTAVGTLGIFYLIENKDLPFYFKDGNLIWIREIDKSINNNYLNIFLNTEYIKR